MKKTQITAIAFAAVVLTVLGGMALAQQDKYTLKVTGGLAFSAFKGDQGSKCCDSQSANWKLVAVIVANPAMIAAYKVGIPDNGKPFPDGAKMAKIHWGPEKQEYFPNTRVPGNQHDVDFMEKDSKRFAESNGWGYAMFEYDAASETFRPGTTTDQPPQGNDAKCGVACHTIVKTRDYVFTDYGKR